MTYADLGYFLSGALMMASLAIGLIFLRFYRRTRDRFFAMFALAFWVLALNRIALVITNQNDEEKVIFYAIRLAAYLLILTAIIDKNRSRNT